MKCIDIQLRIGASSQEYNFKHYTLISCSFTFIKQLLKRGYIFYIGRQIATTMIIYGSKATPLAKETQFEKCRNCGTNNSVDLYVIQKYAHVFWIPFFPMRKTGVSQCSHCKQGLRLNEMPDSLRSSYDVLKKQAKAPAWTFIGVGLVAVLIVFGIISAREEEARNAKLVAEPKAGDIYEIKNDYDSYTIYIQSR